MHIEKPVKDTSSRMFRQLEMKRMQQFQFIDNRDNVLMQKENTIHYLSFDNRNSVYQRNFGILHNSIRNRKTKHQLSNQLFPIQCILKYNETYYNDIDKLTHDYPDIKIDSIIHINPSKIKGGRRTKPETIQKEKGRLWELFKTLIADPRREIEVIGRNNLHKAILEYEEALQIEDNPVPEIEDTKIQGYIKNGRLFPAKNVFDIWERAKSQHVEVARGFSYELSLALSALEQDTKTYVQMGAIQNFNVAPPPVQQAICKGQKTVISSKRIGADIVVWQPANQINPQLSPELYGADFVQAKCCKFESACRLMDQAKNQLEGKAASGRAESTSDRECTLTGKNYMGSIFISIIDDIRDVGVLERSALRCISNSLFVHSVVIEAKDGTKYFYSSVPSEVSSDSY